MSTKTDYSADEWIAISGAPLAAGLFITLSDASGLVGIAKEAMAVGKTIAGSAQGDVPEIVKSLAESVKTGGGRPELPDIPRGDRAQTNDAVIGVIRKAVEAVERKSPNEVEGFKVWLASVARRCRRRRRKGAFSVSGGL